MKFINADISCLILINRLVDNVINDSIVKLIKNLFRDDQWFIV